jgi:pimeloyl-ACP methyl ester carboxylesterase
MNESSSKFVDQFALEKLLNEKLSKVHHSPFDSYFCEDKSFFNGFKSVAFDAAGITFIQDDLSHRVIKIASPVIADPYPENNIIYLHFHPAAEARGNILLVHGLFDDNMLNYNFLFQLLKEAGFNIFLLELPYHYQRKPAESLFSGEFFWSADLFRSQHAAKQAVFDLQIAVALVKHLIPLPTMLAGYSMGGCVSLRYYQLENCVDALFLINPVTRLSQLIWESPLLCSVQNDLENAGFNLDRAQSFFQVLDPVNNISSNLSKQPVAIGYSIYDQVIEEQMYIRFIDQFKFKTVFSYHAGHLNILRVPKLSNDMVQFFDCIVKQEF